MAHSVKNKKFQNSILQSKLIVAVLDLNSYVQQNIMISWVEMKNQIQCKTTIAENISCRFIWIRHKLSLTTLIVKKSLLHHSCILLYTLVYVIPCYIPYYQEYPKNLAQNCWQKNWIHLWLGHRILRDL